MDVDDLVTRAWEAVKKSGVPESLQETAFKEAIAALRAEDDGPTTIDAGGNKGSGRRQSGKKGSSRAAKDAVVEPRKKLPDQATFFKTLASESDVPEKDLRDVLQLTSEGEVQVTQPTRKLGSSTAEQAQTTIILVAGARGSGLGENPVDGKAVRHEVERKRCYQSSNYSNRHLGGLDGFNAGGRDEIVLTSKWVGEFKPAVRKVLGQKTAEDKLS